MNVDMFNLEKKNHIGVTKGNIYIYEIYKSSVLYIWMRRDILIAILKI